MFKQGLLPEQAGTSQERRGESGWRVLPGAPPLSCLPFAIVLLK